jgi:hypothetical protein
MPSAQDCAERLQEQAYKTLLPQIQGLEQELQSIKNFLTTGLHQVGQKLEALRHIELPTTEVVLGELLDEVIRQRDLETNSLVLFARGLRRRETQEEILTLLLDDAQKYSPRTALFAIRGDRYIGWSSRGFSDSLASSISSFSLPRSECPQFLETFESEGPVTVSELPVDDSLRSLLQEDARGPWHLFPLHVMQRPVALLLAGESEDSPCHQDALSILINFTVLRLENVALRVLYDLTAAKPEPTAPPVPAAAIETAPAKPPAAPPSAEQVEEPVQAEEPVFSAPDLGFEPAPSVEYAAVEPAAAELAVPAIEHADIPAPAPPPEAMKAQPQEVSIVPEEEKLHTDAKRFARLLVSEIKLYNEHHVVEGRQNRDLYLRLKRDIDRSREMYEKRVSPSVSRKIDYFHDEIIRILGDNDPSTLGSDYPGPRVES